MLDLVATYMLVVDALDEYADSEDCDQEDFPKLLGYLRRVGRRPNARVVLLSRTGAFSEDIFADTVHLAMTEDVVKKDIAIFVEQEIENNSGKYPGLQSLKPEVVFKVSTTCQGVFLLAKFMMRSLRRGGTANAIRAILDDCPSRLTAFYWQQLEMTSRRLSGNEKATRRNIFLILVRAFEPFSAQAISSILALNTESNSIDKGELFSNPVAEVLRLCRPLVRVVKDQVQFVHASAKRFLEDFVVTREDSDEYFSRKCLSQLSESQFKLWNFAARLLRKNLVLLEEVDTGSEPSVADSAFYNYACLYWQEHVTALSNPQDEILVRLSRFLTGIEFVSSSETLFQLKPKSGVGTPIQVKPKSGVGTPIEVKSVFSEWYRKLSPETQEKIPIEDFFVKAYELASTTFMEKSKDKILPLLPLVRLGQYFSVGGRTGADFQRAYNYKMTVAAGYEKALGSNNPLTLRAKTELFKECFYLKRFDEAERGLADVANIQHEVIGEDFPDYFITLQLLGLTQLSVTKFEQAISTLTKAAGGFRKLSGDSDLNTLVSEMFKGHALEREARFDEAYRVYDDVLNLWAEMGPPRHPFSLMLKTALGSACRQLGRFATSEEVLLESLAGRIRLFTIENVTCIDSVLQLAALYYVMGRRKDCIETLDLISNSDCLKSEFERQCQLTHIRALIEIGEGLYAKAKAALQHLLHEASGEELERNNRELLWVRITLADVLRRCGEYDEALMVFSGLVLPRTVKLSLIDEPHEEEGGYAFPSSLVDEPEPPAQLTIAEQALRLIKDAKPGEGDLLLRENGLKWKRKKSFWVLQGGPITDTASISGVNPSASG
jgi:tetratricopeptide (TPR) repeat protein